MSPRTQTALAACLVSWLALMALAGSSRLSGPVIWRFDAAHGVHADDLLVILAWAGCMAWCWQHWRRGEP